MRTRDLYLNGAFVEMKDSIEVMNPATEEPIARVGVADRTIVRDALQNAAAAFKPWRKLPAKTRADYLLAIAANLTARTEEIARIVTEENGKPISQGRGGVAVSVDHLRWFAEESRRAY